MNELVPIAQSFMAVAAVTLVIVVAVAVAVYVYQQNKKRREAFLALARRLNLMYNPGTDDTLPGTYNASNLCSAGHSKRASNVIWGGLGGGEVCYFDYRYTTGSGKNQSTHYYSACAFHSPYFWRRLFIRPENFLDKAAGFFGFEDINLDNAEFNRKFFVKCEDKKFAYDVLSQRAMEFFLARPGLTMEMYGNCMLFYRPGTLAPEAIESLIVDSPALLDLMPNYLREDRDVTRAKPLAAPGGHAAPGHAGAPPKTGFVPDKPADHHRPQGQA